MEGLSEVSRSSPASDSRQQQDFREGGHILVLKSSLIVFLRFVVLVQDPSVALNLQPQYSFFLKKNNNNSMDI